MSVSLSPSEFNYAIHLRQELNQFVKSLEFHCLVLPPLSARLRFLAHTEVEAAFAGELRTFSVGQGDRRRTIVCRASTSTKPLTRMENCVGTSTEASPSPSPLCGGIERPKQRRAPRGAVYVPPGRRDSFNDQSHQPSPVAVNDANDGAGCSLDVSSPLPGEPDDKAQAGPMFSPESMSGAEAGYSSHPLSPAHSPVQSSVTQEQGLNADTAVSTSPTQPSRTVLEDRSNEQTTPASPVKAQKKRTPTQVYQPPGRRKTSTESLSLDGSSSALPPTTSISQFSPPLQSGSSCGATDPQGGVASASPPPSTRCTVVQNDACKECAGECTGECTGEPTGSTPTMKHSSSVIATASTPGIVHSLKTEVSDNPSPPISDASPSTKPTGNVSPKQDRMTSLEQTPETVTPSHSELKKKKKKRRETTKPVKKASSCNASVVELDAHNGRKENDVAVGTREPQPVLISGDDSDTNEQLVIAAESEVRRKRKKKNKKKAVAAVAADPVDDWEAAELDEIVAALDVQDKSSVRMKRPDVDLREAARVEEPMYDTDDYGHVLEVYGFDPSEQTSFINQSLSSISMNNNFLVRWIDDTHCLASFSSQMAARDALSAAVAGYCGVQLRPLSQATKASRDKAAAFVESAAESSEPRPEKTAMVARRLISGALGVRLSITPEAREKEKQTLRDARERKRDVTKKKADVWGSD